jgi:hypothetical protein
VTISNHSLLVKIEEEVIKAKQINDISKLRKHVYTIKTLCELLLDQEGTNQSEQAKPVIPVTVSALPYEKSEPLKTDDGSNGDSIFDF